MSDELELVQVSGVEGPSIYLNDFRIAGPKPWGGGQVVNRWKVRAKDIRTAIGESAPVRHTTETTVQDVGIGFQLREPATKEGE